jgi:hypothetical protein
MEMPKIKIHQSHNIILVVTTNIVIQNKQPPGEIYISSESLTKEVG